jgi:inorganic pyrophosphatase
LLWTVVAGQVPAPPPDELPAFAAAQLASSLGAAKAHAKHLWRDTQPMNDDGTVNAYVEIARGERRKWEFDMRENRRAVDRVMPRTLGGYPVNYGFVPQTVSYDGDPFDALVIGPPIPGGRIVRGAIVGLFLMDDEKGWDAKVVLSRLGADGRPLHRLTERDRHEMSAYFSKYKQHEPGKFSKVSGWGSVEDGLAHVKTTHAFFRECQGARGSACRVTP